MNEFLQAADDARRLLAGFKAVAVVADAFEHAGRVIQARDEAVTTLAETAKQVGQAKDELESLRTQGLAAIDAANAEATRITEQSAAMLRDAEAKAESIVREAREAGEVALAVAAEGVHQLQADAEAACKQRDAALTALAEAEGKLAAAREQIVKLLG